MAAADSVLLLQRKAVAQRSLTLTRATTMVAAVLPVPAKDWEEPLAAVVVASAVAEAERLERATPITPTAHQDWPVESLDELAACDTELVADALHVSPAPATARIILTVANCLIPLRLTERLPEQELRHQHTRIRITRLVDRVTFCKTVVDHLLCIRTTRGSVAYRALVARSPAG